VHADVNNISSHPVKKKQKKTDNEKSDALFKTWSGPALIFRDKECKRENACLKAVFTRVT